MAYKSVERSFDIGNSQNNQVNLTVSVGNRHSVGIILDDHDDKQHILKDGQNHSLGSEADLIKKYIIISVNVTKIGPNNNSDVTVEIASNKFIVKQETYEDQVDSFTIKIYFL